jgi:hypothetical protein
LKNCRCYNVTGGSTNIANIKTNEAKAYPNPANDFITISYKLDGTQLQLMTITDMSGKVMDNILLDPNQDSYTLGLAKYTAGVYIYNYNNTSGKFIVN